MRRLRSSLERWLAADRGSNDDEERNEEDEDGDAGAGADKPVCRSCHDMKEVEMKIIKFSRCHMVACCFVRASSLNGRVEVIAKQ